MNNPELLGLATLGKTAAALALIIALILLCSALLRRLGPGRGHRANTLRVISGTAVGNRERVVVVEVQGTWLVLGVASGQVSKLHSLPAPEQADEESSDEGFPARFARALHHHVSGTEK